MPQWFVVENNKRREHLAKVGIPVEDLARWVAKWHALEVHCKQNGKSLDMNFYDYIDLAVAAGIFDHAMIGKAIDSYQLGRYGDQGGYSTTNCRFITKRQNLEERHTSGAIARATEAIKKSWETRSVLCRITKGSESIDFNSLKDCAEYLGSYSPTVSSAIEKGREVAGWKVERLERPLADAPAEPETSSFHITSDLISDTFLK